MNDSDSHITQWLQAWQKGDLAARDHVFAGLYAELRRFARSVLRQHAGHDTLQPTALLHDALLKMTGAQAPAVENRQHFVRVVARAMRQVLTDRARRKLADKRGQGQAALALDENDLAADADPAELVAVDDALGRLAALDARAAEVVELRVFAGLTIDETAAALEIHPSAVNREWTFARSWLRANAYSHD